jgi:hypothetical protein
VSPGAAFAQTATNLEALRGLVPVSVLGATTAGKARYYVSTATTRPFEFGDASFTILTVDFGSAGDGRAGCYDRVA